MNALRYLFLYLVGLSVNVRVVGVCVCVFCANKCFVCETYDYYIYVLSWVSVISYVPHNDKIH